MFMYLKCHGTDVLYQTVWASVNNESCTVVQTDFALKHVQQAPLHIAAGGGHDHTVLHLADNGADVNIKDNNGVSKGIKNC